MTLYDQNPNLDYTLDLDVAGPIPSPARTEKQIHASRVNGSKSRGPVTPEGKAISSRNTAFNDATARPYPRNAHSKTGVYGQHGMLAKVILLEGESLEIFREFMHSLEATWQPVGPIEDSFLEIMALAQWRRMRLLGMERAGFNHQIAIETELDPATCAFLAFTTLAEQSRVIELMYRYDARCDDQYDRALTRLFEAQKRRRENSICTPTNPRFPIPATLPHQEGCIMRGRLPDPAPAVAPQKEHREIRHGELVVDNYYWLREKSNQEVIRYLEAENAYTAAMTKELQPFQETLYKEMLSHIKETDLSVPVRRGEYLYYSRTEEGRQYPIQCRRKGSMEGAEELLLDLNELAKDRQFVSLGGMVVSDDQNLLAYTADYSGFRQYGLHIKDLRTGETLPDTAERVTSVEWAADNRTILLTTEDAVTKRSDKLWRHAIGSNALELVYEEKDELYEIGLAKTRDREYLLLRSESKDTTEFRYLRADRPLDNPVILLPREKGHRYYPDHREGLFYIRTNKQATNFRVVTAPATDPSPANWKEFIPHQADVLNADIDLFRDFAVVVERAEALNRLRVYRFVDATWASIAFAEPVYAASPGVTPEYDSKTYRYNYQSLITPPSVFDYDHRSGESQLLKRQEVPGGYDSSQYTSERLWATARDGVRVPISIVHRKDFVRDGSGPLFLYAYGSYGFGTQASFSSSRLSLLDRGMAYAIAHIRGGDEMGENWRLDGMLMKKKNTFSDFIDSAEYLIAEKWTSPDRIAIEGRSAGGLLMGAVVNMRPDLFRAVHAGVPFVDVMNTMMDRTLPLTVGEYLEWGDPNEKAAYDYMKSYSPYDNLRREAYPAMLLTSSLNDSQVMYWEPAKYVARMRTLKTGDQPLLLKIKMDPAGHGGASGRYDRLKDQAFEYAWILQQVGLSP